MAVIRGPRKINLPFAKDVKMGAYKVILPGPFHDEKLRQEIRNVIHRTQTKMRSLFEKTVETWATRVDFDVKESTAGGVAYAEVSTDSPLYYLINVGAEEHQIPAGRFPTLVYQRDYSPKTAVKGLFSENSYHGGGYARPIEITHFGFDARKFDEAVRDEIREDFERECQEALDNFARKSGHGMNSSADHSTTRRA